MNNAMISRSVCSGWLLATSGKGTHCRCTRQNTPHFSFWLGSFAHRCGCAAFSCEVFLDLFFLLFSQSKTKLPSEAAGNREAAEFRHQTDATLCNQEGLSDQSVHANRIMSTKLKLAETPLEAVCLRCDNVQPMKEMNTAAQQSHLWPNRTQTAPAATDWLLPRWESGAGAVKPICTFCLPQNHDLIFQFFRKPNENKETVL